MVEFYGENPFYLLIHPDGTESLTGIDLDYPGWAKTHADLMRAPGRWYLVAKEGNRPLLSLVVLEGEQPYYTAHHVGKIGSGGGNEIIAYGIGKKQFDGSMIRVWLLPDGTVCGGDDVDILGIDIVNRLGPRVAAAE